MRRFATKMFLSAQKWYNKTKDKSPNNRAFCLFERGRKMEIKRGQIWRLGEHYLMCGDATKKEDVNKLLRSGARDRFVFDRSAL